MWMSGKFIAQQKGVKKCVYKYNDVERSGF